MIDSLALTHVESQGLPLVASVLRNYLLRHMLVGRGLSATQLVPGQYRTAAGTDVEVVSVPSSVSPVGLGLIVSDNDTVIAIRQADTSAGKVRATRPLSAGHSASKAQKE
jgi:hypothetical protein